MFKNHIINSFIKNMRRNYLEKKIITYKKHIIIMQIYKKLIIQKLYWTNFKKYHFIKFLIFYQKL